MVHPQKKIESDDSDLDYLCDTVKKSDAKQVLRIKIKKLEPAHQSKRNLQVNTKLYHIITA